MSIKFPDFRDTRCIGLGSCGTLETNDEKLIAIAKKTKNDILIASYRTAGTTAYIQVVLGGENPKHFHINVFKRDFFNREPPKTTLKRLDLEQLLDPFMGERIKTRTFGRFHIALVDLPKGGLISSTFSVKKEGDLSIVVSGASFAITGAPICGIEWELLGETASVAVEMNAMTTDRVIGKGYLIEQLRLLDSGFRLFVLGERSGGTDQTE